MPKAEASIVALRAELARARSLIPRLTALVDHYASAYQECQQRLVQRELVELRRAGDVRRL